MNLGGGGVGGGGDGGGGGGGGGGSCSSHPHLISVSVGWETTGRSNLLEDVPASTRDENDMQKRNNTIVSFLGLQIWVEDTIVWLGTWDLIPFEVRYRNKSLYVKQGVGLGDVLSLSLLHE